MVLKTIKKFLLLALILLSYYQFIGCQTIKDYHKNYFLIIINQWSLKLENKSYNVKPVPWEYSREKGGGGIQYDGFATYIAKFSLPRDYREEDLGLYIECIKDAANIYINEHYLGNIGNLPKRRNYSDFLSGYMLPKSFLIPQKILREENIIKIKVFNYAGFGGFCFKQTPTIGPYKIIESLYIQKLLPRIGIRILFFIFLIGNIITLSLSTSSEDIRNSIKELKDFINPKSFFKIKYKEININILKTYSLMIFFSLAIIQIYFLPIKYYIIESQIWWMKIISFLSFFIAGITETITLGITKNSIEILYNKLKRKKYLEHIITLILFLTYPLWHFTISFLSITILDARTSWNILFFFGLKFFFIIAIIFITLILVFHIIKGKAFEIPEIVFTILILAISILLLKKTNADVSIFGEFLLIIYIYAIIFIKLNQETDKKVPLLSYETKQLHQERIHHLNGISPKEEILRKRLKGYYNLTPTEIEIVLLILKGKTRDYILQIFNIKPNTLKTHLRNIYSKIGEKHDISFKKDAFQKLSSAILEEIDENDRSNRGS